MDPDSGLFPVYISNELEKPRFASNQISLGALGDSFYEYLLKVWLQGGKQESIYRKMYDKSIDGIMNVLLKKSAPNTLSYIAEIRGDSIQKKMDHLACFLPGKIFSSSK